jgi:hypothetical protein
MQEALIKTSKLLREKEKKIKELESKGSVDVAALAQEPLKQKIAAYEAEITQLRNANAAVSVESIPQVQQHIIQPLQQAAAFINQAAKTNDGLDTRALFAAAQEPDAAKRKAAVRAACTDVHPADALQLEYAVDAIFVKNAELGNVRANATKIMEAQRKQQSEQTAQQQAAVRSESVKAHDATFKNVIMADPVLAQLASDPETKKQFEAILEDSKASELDTAWVMDHGKRSALIQMGKAYPLVMKLYQKKLGQILKQNKDLLAQNLKLKGPIISTDRRTPYVPPASSDKPVSTESLVKDAFRGKL